MLRSTLLGLGLLGSCALGWDARTCDVSKGCYREPADCDPGADCTYALSWQPGQAGRIEIELAGAGDKNYVALGLSSDRAMGSDFVLFCTPSLGGPPRAYAAINPGGRDPSNILAPDLTDSLVSLTSLSETSGRLACSMSLSGAVPDNAGIGPTLKTPLYLLFARGTVSSPASILYHDLGKLSETSGRLACSMSLSGAVPDNAGIGPTLKTPLYLLFARGTVSSPASILYHDLGELSETSGRLACSMSLSGAVPDNAGIGPTLKTPLYLLFARGTVSSPASILYHDLGELSETSGRLACSMSLSGAVPDNAGIGPTLKTPLYLLFARGTVSSPASILYHDLGELSETSGRLACSMSLSGAVPDNAGIGPTLKTPLYLLFARDTVSSPASILYHDLGELSETSGRLACSMSLSGAVPDNAGIGPTLKTPLYLLFARGTVSSPASILYHDLGELSETSGRLACSMSLSGAVPDNAGIGPTLKTPLYLLFARGTVSSPASILYHDLGELSETSGRLACSMSLSGAVPDNAGIGPTLKTPLYLLFARDTVSSPASVLYHDLGKSSSPTTVNLGASFGVPAPPNAPTNAQPPVQPPFPPPSLPPQPSQFPPPSPNNPPQVSAAKAEFDAGFANKLTGLLTRILFGRN